MKTTDEQLQRFQNVLGMDDEEFSEALSDLGQAFANAIGRNEGILRQNEDIDDITDDLHEFIDFVELVQDRLVFADINKTPDHPHSEYELEYELDYPDGVEKAIGQYRQLDGVGERLATRLYYQFGRLDELDEAPDRDNLTGLLGIGVKRAESIHDTMTQKLK